MKPGRTRAINPHLQTGAHALDALPDFEHAEFETHLNRCQACADETAGLRETAALLGSAVDHLHPRALRARVLNAVKFVQQVPSSSEHVNVSSRRQGLQRAAVLVAAACLVAGAVAGVHGTLTSASTKPVTATSRTPTGDLLAAADLRLVSTADLAGSAALSDSRNEMLFLADGLRTPPPGRAYQLWLVDDHGPRSAGTTHQAGGVASLLVRGFNGASEAILTIEPAGGSSGPTGAPVLTLSLS
ncbi:anti-sigma factor [Lentzea flaviverrucosa]|uniref:Regulator of SigK n=1 Tax=Lentzea flaviverrucosa TaxID=200379 RepID=A0A1H9XSQ6_9PSEU|nr:anti-sigma factor [Lentzea flaviverrucosa]RDI19312.1 anti-sigma-K factor RskA [Lentzea flaviverrucosa]SES49079.1 Anti-sigma-K factor RskA [Lentzea flaviverrucosa]